MNKTRQLRKQAAVITGALLHRLFDTGLANILRRGPIGKLTRPYYAGLSRLGFQSGHATGLNPSTARTLLPKSRYIFGGLLPNASGLGDYEFGRLMGHTTRTSPEVASAFVAPNPSNAVLSEQVMDQMKPYIKSPLLENYVQGVRDRMANRPLPRMLDTLAHKFTGAEQQSGVASGISALTGMGGAALHGGDPTAGLGAMLANAPDAGMLAALSKNKFIPQIKSLKEDMLVRGYNQAQRTPTWGSRIANVGLNAVSPVGYEFLEMGQDLGRMSRANINPAQMRTLHQLIEKHLGGRKLIRPLERPDLHAVGGLLQPAAA